MVTKDVPPNCIVAGNPARNLTQDQPNLGGNEVTHSNGIPFLDLITPHVELEQELTSVFHQVIRSAGFIGGPMVEQFEKAFAEFCACEHTVAVSSGTDALRFALMACGVKQGDVVITVPHTFIATAEAISQAGACAEFVDIDERTYNMDPAKLQDYLENQCATDELGRLISCRSGRPVTAVIPVHLYGQTADMDPILELADRYGLILIEDACQAHGAEYFSKKKNRWMKAGSMGRAAAFSFYPGKNLGACGEAGAVTTHDAELAKRVKMLRDHGQVTKYYHEVEGYNGRLDALQAGILHVKLQHLAEWNDKRRERAAEYDRLLKSVADVVAPYQPNNCKAVYHLYVVRSKNREGLMGQLKQHGIGSGIHYPIPLHLQNAYSWMEYKEGDLPVTEKVAREIVSLPMFPQLTAQQQRRVVDEIVSFTSSAVVSTNAA